RGRHRRRGEGRAGVADRGAGGAPGADRRPRRPAGGVPAGEGRGGQGRGPGAGGARGPRPAGAGRGAGGGAVRDTVALGGCPTAIGSAPPSPEPAAADDELVRRLREAGALLVGKT